MNRTEVIPAIDLRGGRCVRLYQGDYGRETVYGDDPVAMALHWQELGATRLHVVDLDGARSGEQANAGAVLAIVKAVKIPVELGGGVRSLETVSQWVDAGVGRVFLGTAAVEDPGIVAIACARFPGRVAAGADARDGRIAVRGWESSSGEPVEDFVRRALDAGVCAVSYTDIARDGTLSGVDVEGVRALLAAVQMSTAQFIVAGGVGSIDDITGVAAIEGVDAVIVGRALYDGRVDLQGAIESLRGR
jgi:phosphoribosylformimino-5-aminoimidazole carboxamide ribotide isomerase